jgi:Iron-sulphur cluster biosynthesis
MLTLTPAAAGKVKELLVEEGRDDIALRVAVQPGGCSGLRYAMYLDDQVSEKDASEEQHGVRSVPLPGDGRLHRHAGAIGVHDRQPGGPGRLRLRPLVPLIAGSDPVTSSARILHP